jgi:hypothetical protein
MPMAPWSDARPLTPHAFAPCRFLVALCIAWSGLCTLPVAADSSPAADPVEYTDSALNGATPHAASRFTPTLDLEPEARDAAAQPGEGYRWRAPPAAQPDWGGVGRDTAYFLGYQVFAMAVLYLAPESITGWEDEEKENYSFDKWRENVSEPVWDEDVWWLNYITHPYWGAAYYTRARERGLNQAQAFWYAALLSTFWEYGPEALAEPVSIQDLIVTPVAGALVGEYLFSPLRTRIRSKPGGLDWQDKALLFLTDPLGVLNAQTDRLLGVKTTLSLQPIRLRGTSAAAGTGNTAPGSRLTPHNGAPAWGLQLRVDW